MEENMEIIDRFFMFREINHPLWQKMKLYPSVKVFQLTGCTLDQWRVCLSVSVRG